MVIYSYKKTQQKKQKNKICHIGYITDIMVKYYDECEFTSLIKTLACRLYWHDAYFHNTFLLLQKV